MKYKKLGAVDMDMTLDNENILRQDDDLLQILDRGIDDMEAGRELPLDEAFQKITELRDIRRNARAWNYFDMGGNNIYYLSYSIFKKTFPPSIIFYVIKEPENEIHILRVLREERDWGKILKGQQNYTYPE